MATKTIELLLQLEAEKTPSLGELQRWMKNLQEQADALKRKISDAIGAGNAAEAKKLQVELRGVENQMRELDGIARKMYIEKSLLAAQKRANELREKMEKLQNVGATLAVGGAAIVAPFAMAIRKYIEAAGMSEQPAARMLEIQNKIAEAQARIGRVAVEQLLPVAEKLLPMIERAAEFAEKHPDAIGAAMAIGGSMIAIGSGLTMAATIVKTLATVQSLAAGFGLSGGTAAAGGIAAGGGGLSAAVASGMAAAAPYIATALAVAVAAELTRVVMNQALGTNQTWSDVKLTFERLLVISAEGWDGIFAWLGMDTNFSQSVANALGIADVPKQHQIADEMRAQGEQTRGAFAQAINQMGAFMSQAFGSVGNGIIQVIGGLPIAITNALARIMTGVVSGQRAEGGYVGAGLYQMGERGREYVLSAGATRAAEQIIGSPLSQANIIAALAAGGSRRIQYNDHRRIDSRLSQSDRQALRDDVLSAIAGAL